jgi:hypothetical protein
MGPFRKEYRPLTMDEADAVKSIKEFAEELHACIYGQVKEGREKSLALTKLEECVMWAVKGVTG